MPDGQTPGQPASQAGLAEQPESPPAFEPGVPLEDPTLLWTRVQAGGALVPWSPPVVGESQVLPAVAPR